VVFLLLVARLSRAVRAALHGSGDPCHLARQHTSTPARQHAAADDVLLAGQQLAAVDCLVAQRFLDARGLFHGLFTSHSSQRLVTRAYTWDQQASRAFAAELLAPRAALAARFPAWADRAAVEQLAQEFLASTRVIENQLENAGVALDDD